MRIVAGTARGRRLAAPARSRGRPRIRPTADRAREALFSIIGRKVEGAEVLDLCAGTGALGLEALSRGAEFGVLVDKEREALALIRKNIELCGFSDRSRLLGQDLTKGLSFLTGWLPAAGGFSLVFLDPPYSSQLGQRLILELAMAGLLQPGAMVVAEDAPQENYPEGVGKLVQFDRRRYGDTGFWFYRFEEAER